MAFPPLRDSGRPLTQVAAELGLKPSVLRRWRGLANGTGGAASVARPGGVAVAASAEPMEIRHVRWEELCPNLGDDGLRRAAYRGG